MSTPDRLKQEKGGYYYGLHQSELIWISRLDKDHKPCLCPDLTKVSIDGGVQRWVCPNVQCGRIIYTPLVIPEAT